MEQTAAERATNVVSIAPGDNSIAAFDVERVRADFPILNETVYGKPLVYFDNAASAQTPIPVLNAMQEAYERYYSNVHRGVHHMSQRSTEAFEAGRQKVAAFLNAATDEEIILTRGTTESINLVAATYGRKFLKEGDEIILTVMEHHSNIVPWQLLREERGIVIKVVPIDDEGNFLLEEFEKLLGPKTKLVALTHIANSLGTIVPIKEVVRLAHAHGAKVLVDGAQAVPHFKIDVRDLDVDFYAFSSHKLYGPTGIGVLYGKMELLEAMPPYQGGGEMIDVVTFEETTFKAPPHRFEAGTPAIVEAIGLGAAVDYVEALGLDSIGAHEAGLGAYAKSRLAEIPEIKLHSRAKDWAGIVSFEFEGAHAHDVGTILDRAGVAIRAGHHCAQPVMERFGVSATARASFGLYNTREEVDVLLDALGRVKEIFG